MAWLLLVPELFGQQPTTDFTKPFSSKIKPILSQLCLRCHNADLQESGVRVDHLDGSFNSRQLKLWEIIREQVHDQAMPPEDEKQPDESQRQTLIQFIDQLIIAAKSRKDEKNGSARRLTIAQYANTIEQLLNIEDDLTKILPADAVSKDGFLNNGSNMVLSPLLVEAYFEIAEKALDIALVDPGDKPEIQTFKMELGKDINQAPLPEQLILGAGSRLLQNADFRVSEPPPKKDFPFQHSKLPTKLRFNEGYNGNSTVRGWRDYNSIYHSIFACIRGPDGYPKGRPIEAVPAGLLIRPSIPESEIFGRSSTYGPRANFKIAIRKLPRNGRFRIKVVAAKYNDGLLLDSGSKPAAQSSDAVSVALSDTNSVPIKINQPGIYQVDLVQRKRQRPKPDATNLHKDLVGFWDFEPAQAETETDQKISAGSLAGKAKIAKSFSGSGLSLSGTGSYVVKRTESMDVGKGDFSVAAWIRPRKLKQGGIICLGKYSWTQGWYLDMPNNKGVLRIETAKSGFQSNGTVQSEPGVIRNNQWQHVAAVIRRGDKRTRLYMNGFEVASGTIGDADLDNSGVDLHIGRIQDSKNFQGDIDNVYFFRRALTPEEISAMVEPGKQFAQPPTANQRGMTNLQIDQRHFSGTLKQPAFVVTTLAAGEHKIKTETPSNFQRVIFTPLAADHPHAIAYRKMERRDPLLGVYVGFRRDCGHTFGRVGKPRKVTDTDSQEFVFEGAINNFPRPDVQENNDNYLAGVREIGIRSEYTDGADRPRLLIKSVEFEGPFYETWPPQSHQLLMSGATDITIGVKSTAQNVIRQFAERAFRRPVHSDEWSRLMKTWQQAFEFHKDNRLAIRDTFLVILTSPQFLFLIENSKSPKPEPIDDFELASKLSYFLWNSPPDPILLKLAAEKTLREKLDQQIERIVADDKFDRFAVQFTTQWLSLDKLSTVEFDSRTFPHLTRDTKPELIREPIEWFKFLVRSNLSAKHLIESDRIVANEVVAKYYGLQLDQPDGFEFVPTSHQDPNLGGLLSQAGILAALSDGRESNPIKRGAWFARKIIAKPPADPPPNVPQLAEPENKSLSLRERLEQHRNQKGCAKCHSGIDPWGLPFEQFAADGLFSSADKDPRSTLPDQTEINGVNQLKAYLATKKLDRVAFSLRKHLSIYAIGRDLTYNELEYLKAVGLKSGESGYKMKTILKQVINSPLFLEK